jgi:hypothetical protein
VSSDLAKRSDFVYIWDIDKTYLDTHFESLRGLVSTFVEKAFQKRNVPGTRSLVQAITASQSQARASQPFPIFFITASPPQMEERIRGKLELDGLSCFGTFYKDNLKNLKIKRFHKLTQQVGYKLQALLQLRTRLSDSVRQVLWGDDSETDAVIYSLYSDICARRIEEGELRQVLDGLHVEPARVDLLIKLQRDIPTYDPVDRIYINLANDTDPDFYAKYGRRTMPTINTFQAAIDLFKREKISSEQLIKIAEDLVVNFRFTSDELADSLDDLLQRKEIEVEFATFLQEILTPERLLPFNYIPSIQNRRNLYLRSEDQADEWVPEKIDYLNDF